MFAPIGILPFHINQTLLLAPDTGGRDLKQTQAYPGMFGLEVLSLLIYIPLKTKLECGFGFAWWWPVSPPPHGSRILTEETPVNMQKHS